MVVKKWRYISYIAFVMGDKDTPFWWKIYIYLFFSMSSLTVFTLISIARRHGHVFRMALHNEGDWRMETWQRARRASCHVSIRQSPSCVMPFWTHAKCLLAFISYLPMWIKAKYTFIKTVYSPRFYGGPYLQAKHADVCSGVLFWTACTRRPHVLSLPSSSGCEKSDSWRQSRSDKTAKKVMNGTTMWSCDTELCTNGVEATKCWVFVAHFSIYSTSRCRCHTGTDIPRLRGHTLQINQVVRTVRHRISCCTPTIHWKCDAQIQNRQIKSPPALWKHLSFQCLGVIVTLNGKSASMLLEPTKNKLKQWRVIEKSVNKCNFFFKMFWIITKWMKITEKQICGDQIVTFKQSPILLYQGLLFFNTINMCDRGRTITHMQIPRFHTQVWYNYSFLHKLQNNRNPFHPEKYLFQTLTLKILRQCHWWDQKSSHIRLFHNQGAHLHFRVL